MGTEEPRGKRWVVGPSPVGGGRDSLRGKGGSGGILPLSTLIPDNRLAVRAAIKQNAVPTPRSPGLASFPTVTD